MGARANTCHSFPHTQHCSIVKVLTQALNPAVAQLIITAPDGDVNRSTRLGFGANFEGALKSALKIITAPSPLVKTSNPTKITVFAAIFSMFRRTPFKEASTERQSLPPRSHALGNAQQEVANQKVAPPRTEER